MEFKKILFERVERAIAEKVFPGCVIGTIRANSSREIWPFGHLTYDADAPAVGEDTIYDIASVTKSMPTASLALMLMEEGKLHLEDTVRTHLAELQNDFGATIEDLLRYRVRGVQLSKLKDKSADEIIAHVLKFGFEGTPADSHYTNLPAFALGLIVERVGSDTLDHLAQEMLFDPLDMRDTTFFPVASSEKEKIMIYHNIAPTEVVDGREVRGVVHDESARVFAKAKRAVGHAGLFSTAPDLLNFLQALLRADEVMKPIVEGAERGLGWQTSGLFLGSHLATGRFGKTGFTGTSVVCDIEKGIAFVILSNRTYPKRPPDTNAINAFRADIADIIFSRIY